MKVIRYVLVLILSTIGKLLPLIGFSLGLYLYYVYRSPWFMIIAIVASLVGLISAKPLRELRAKYVRDIDYDEYGLSKRKGRYEYLSRKERDVIDLQRTAAMERLVDTTSLKKMTQHGPKDPLKELDEMIGLEPIKDTIKEMVARMQFEVEENKRKSKKNKRTLGGRHMIFFGSPGTGKTSVARIITSFLHKYGYIKENKCIEIDGNFLKAGTNSALKTELVLRQAYGGVLFIDEAYALMDSSDNSGAQVIATLIKKMEDNRDKFILIMAGYSNEIRELIAANPGFESRIKDYLKFPDYNDEEMRKILEYMAKQQGFTIDDNAYSTYDELVRKERKLQSFGNARTSRSILEKAIDKHALNLTKGEVNPTDRYVLKQQDFENLKLGGFNNEKQSQFHFREVWGQ